MSIIHIISTCTNTKRLAVPGECRISSYKDNTYDEVAGHWVGALRAGNNPTCPAQALYQGGHWTETLKCVRQAEAAGFEPSFWILSAGWGLLSATDQVCSYSATFANSGEDSIHKLTWEPEWSTKERSRHWWDAISQQRTGKSLLERLEQERPVRRKKDRPIVLFIMSKDYYQAVEHEILELMGRDYEVMIVSASLYNELSSIHPGLHAAILPFSDKFKQADCYLNKNNISLNAHLGTWLFREHAQTLRLGTAALFAELAKLEQDLPAVERGEVVKMTDEEVLAFIDAHYQPQSAATQLLRILRDQEGKSCEQKRFGGLFRRYQQEHGLKGGLFDV